MIIFQIAIIVIIITVAIPIIPLIITEYIHCFDRNKLEYEDNRKKHRIIKFVGSFETHNKCSLIGIWGFSEKHIMRKIKHLEQNGIIYDSVFAPLREVKHFPSYCEWII